MSAFLFAIGLLVVGALVWKSHRVLRFRTLIREARDYNKWINSLAPKSSDDIYVEPPTDPAVVKAKRYLNKHYLCTVRPDRRKVYSFRKKKHVKLARWDGNIGGDDQREKWPLIGYACPECRTYNNYSRHYLVDKRSICEDCAAEIVIKKLGLKKGESLGTI